MKYLVFLCMLLVAASAHGAEKAAQQVFDNEIERKAVQAVVVLGVFGVGYAGYFVHDAIWPSLYYSPISKVKNIWLLGQALFILLYFIGILMAFRELPPGHSMEHQIG